MDIFFWQRFMYGNYNGISHTHWVCHMTFSWALSKWPLTLAGQKIIFGCLQSMGIVCLHGNAFLIVFISGVLMCWRMCVQKRARDWTHTARHRRRATAPLPAHSTTAVKAWTARTRKTKVCRGLSPSPFCPTEVKSLQKQPETKSQCSPSPSALSPQISMNQLTVVSCSTSSSFPIKVRFKSFSRLTICKPMA